MTVEVHVLASGSDGNCTVIRNEGRAVMIDAGLSYKKLKGFMDLNGIDEKEIEAVLVTHEHSDHISGVGPMVRKLEIARDCEVPIMCNERTFAACGNIGKVYYSPISMMNTFSVAGMDVIALPTSHDAAEPCSYFFTIGDRKVLIATDTGKLTYPVEHALSMADIALVETNYDKHMLDYGPYPPSLKRRIDSDMGHMCNVASAQAIKRTMQNNRRQIFLAHLSRHNNTPDVAKDTVSEITGIRRFRFDCLECQGDTRILKT